MLVCVRLYCLSVLRCAVVCLFCEGGGGWFESLDGLKLDIFVCFTCSHLSGFRGFEISWPRVVRCSGFSVFGEEL